MLIYSENRYISTETNMMIIRAKDNIGYYYVHRGLYDQAVILSDIYKSDYELLCEVLTGKRETRPDVDRFFEELPTPINILGCFLLFVDEELDNLLDMVGAIHVMSNSINFRKVVTLPQEMRANVEFSLSIREEYELPWDRFFKESIPWSADFYTRTADNPMNGTVTATAQTSEEEYDEACVGDDGVVYDDPLAALLYGAGDDIFDMPDDFGEEDTAESESEPEDNTTAIEPQTAVVEVVEPVDNGFVPDQPVVKSGLNFLRGL